jgi:hypothetical protein
MKDEKVLPKSKQKYIWVETKTNKYRLEVKKLLFRKERAGRRISG